MVDKFEDAIKISISSYTRARAALPKKLGNEAVNFFKDSWRKQGWDDGRIIPWKPRKGEIRSGIAKISKKSASGRDILVGKGSGVLRRSFDYFPSRNRVLVINDRVYSNIHNYGLMGRAWGKYPFKMTQRKFMGKSRTLDYKSGVLISRMIKGALR